MFGFCDFDLDSGGALTAQHSYHQQVGGNDSLILALIFWGENEERERGLRIKGHF